MGIGAAGVGLSVPFLVAADIAVKHKQRHRGAMSFFLLATIGVMVNAIQVGGAMVIVTIVTQGSL